MKKVNKKLAVALLALSCASCAVTAGVLANNVPVPSVITASAETRYEVKTLTYTAGSATLIEAYPNDGSGKPTGSWDYAYTLQDGSGSGACLNGEKIACSVKQPNDFYIELGVEAKAGDVFTIDGVFYNETTDYYFIFENCALQFDGEKWGEYKAPEKPEVEYEVKTLTYTAGSATLIEAYPNDGSGKPAGSWDYAYTLQDGSGSGACLNGEKIACSVKQPNDFYIELGVEAKAGDVFTIDGTFYNETSKYAFIFDNCALQFDGEKWGEYKAPVEPDEPDEPEVDYPDCNVGKLFVSGGNNQHVYFKPVDESVTLTVNSWDYAFSYVSGNGITVNGEMINMENSVKSPDGSFFADLGAPAQEGDILKIGGVLRCKGGQVDYVIEERSFQWTGSEWKVYGEEIVYTDYKLGKMNLNWPSTKASNAQSGQLYLNQENGEDLPYPDASWETVFVYESGDGLKVNGNEAYMATMKSTNLGLFVEFVGVNVGDVVSISGTFACEGKAAKYIIDESSFIWTGKGWLKNMEYKPYEIGAVIATADSTANQVYVHPVNDAELPFSSWEEADAFAYGGGNGITLNGEMINMQNSVKSVEGNIFIDLGKTAAKGDVLIIGGEFYSEGKAIKYIVTETKLVFDGTVWLDELGVAKRDNKAALDEYKATFVAENYYEAEWASFDKIVEEAKAKIDGATTIEETKLALEAAKTAMDEVVTKEESDAIFEGMKETEKTALAAYKSEADYREAEWTSIQAIIAEANTAIEAAESVTAINEAVNTAKTAIDALKTKAQWEADEAAVKAAKDELAGYKTEADYREAEWTAIQAVITKANTAIEAAIGNAEEIDSLVAAAKEEMDSFKTAATWEADEGVVAAAKEELDGYATEANYKAAEWATIQAIIAQAKTDIEAAIGDEEAIAELVNGAKAAIDEVQTATEVEAAALAAAKTAAKNEVRAYYNAIDHDKYSEEAETELSGFVAAANTAIDTATTEAEVAAAVAQFKTNVDGVQKIQVGGGDEKPSSGCGSVVGGGAAIAMAAAAAVALLRKKKED